MCVYLSVWFLCASGLVGHITWWLFVQSTKCATLASLQTFGVKLLASLITALHVVTQCSQSTYLGFWASGVSTTNEVITTSLSDFSSLSGQVRRVKICKSMISLCAPPPNLSRCHTHLSDTSKFQQKFMVNMMISLVSLMKPANCLNRFAISLLYQEKVVDTSSQERQWQLNRKANDAHYASLCLVVGSLTCWKCGPS